MYNFIIMGLGAKLADAATSGLTGAVTGGIGSIVSGGLGLLGGLFKKNNNGFKNQQKLMQQAWEYEKEGMGLQYNYGQQAADAEYGLVFEWKYSLVQFSLFFFICSIFLFLS